MEISELMTKTAVRCRPDDTLADAAQRMWDHDCGCLPVTDDDSRVVGIITDRDVCMAAHFQGRALGSIRVRDAMARGVRACNADDDVAEAEAIMRETQVRRLPVVDRDDRLVGMVSLADLARRVGRGRHHVKATGLVETLAGICEPRKAAAAPTA